MNIEEQRYWDKEEAWEKDGHEWSEHFGGTDALWNKYLFDLVKPFRNKKIVEIAPGFGRMTQYLALLTDELEVVDLNEHCIKVTQSKLKHHVKGYYINDGRSLPMFEDTSVDLVFSYDSFVHMHETVVEAYTHECSRILKPGGFGLIHHSNFIDGEDLSFSNTAGRANMTLSRFNEMLRNSNLVTVSSTPIDFPSVTDYITLFRKEK